MNRKGKQTEKVCGDGSACNNLWNNNSITELSYIQHCFLLLFVQHLLIPFSLVIIIFDPERETMVYVRENG